MKQNLHSSSSGFTRTLVPTGNSLKTKIGGMVAAIALGSSVAAYAEQTDVQSPNIPSGDNP